MYGMNSSFNKQICDGSSILHNGTVYNFPNITSNNECITRVDRLSDKFILHHSTLAPSKYMLKKCCIYFYLSSGSKSNFLEGRS